MTPDHKSLYPAELSRFLPAQNTDQFSPVSLPIDELLFPRGQAKLWHEKRQSADPVPPWTWKQVLMPWTRPPLTPEQRIERKLQD